MFHIKRHPFCFFLELSRMPINLYEIFTSCSWRSNNSKYFVKIWLVVKYTLLFVMERWRRNVLWVQACLSQLVLPVATVLRWWTLSGLLIKMFIVAALSNMGHEIKRLAIQKRNHFASGVCWCTVLLESVKVRLSRQVCKSDRFERFCGCNGIPSTICYQ